MYKLDFEISIFKVRYVNLNGTILLTKVRLDFGNFLPLFLVHPKNSNVNNIVI